MKTPILPANAADYPKTTATRLAMTAIASRYAECYSDKLMRLSSDSKLQKKALHIQKHMAEHCHTFAAMGYNTSLWEEQISRRTAMLRRSGILGELNKDYVRTAHSRGNDRGAILYRHVLRNAVVPTVAFLAMTIADIVAGSVVIEQVFAIPGMGRLLFSSISNRDYPVVQAVIVLMAFWVVLVNFLADMINQRLDPRLRLQ